MIQTYAGSRSETERGLNEYGPIYTSNNKTGTIKDEAHEPTSPMRVRATRRFFFGGSGALSYSSLSKVVGIASLALAAGVNSGRTSLSGTTLLTGVRSRFEDVRGDNDGGRETVDNAGVVDGVRADEDVNGTE